MNNYSTVGIKGTMKDLDVRGTTSVFESPFGDRGVRMACCVGADDCGLAVWRIMIHRDVVEGEWYLIDDEFTPVNCKRPVHCAGFNSPTTKIQRPGNSCLPIRRRHMATPFSPQVFQSA